ncbi:TPA: cytochrome b562 [Escherichia coli]
MEKVKCLTICSTLLLYFGGGNISSAKELGENMQILADNIGILQSSTNKKEMIDALEIMELAVNDSMKSLPEKISYDDKKGGGEYKNELMKLNNEIVKAKEKVVSGDISDVPNSVMKMHKIRIEGHKKFR